MPKTSHRTAVLTGGASGIGLACARFAARQGMNVVLVDVEAGALERAQADITALAQPLGARVAAHRVNVADAEQMEALAKAVQSDFGAPHLVFNNAGVSFGGLVWEGTARDWDWVMGVNVMGVAHGVRVFTGMMLAAADADPSYQGHIVNTASMAGLVSTSMMGLYAVSKHAVVALSEALYHDLALMGEQVHAHVLCPYYVPTSIHASNRNREESAQPASALTLSQKAARALSEHLVTQTGTVTAADVAQQVFDALHERRFYIHTNPENLAVVSQRAADIVAASNPRDPFEVVNPERNRALRAALRQP